MAINNANFVNLIGNLGADPVVKILPSGLQVAEFSLATSNKYTNREGTRVEQTDWHRIKAFGKVAEVMGQYLRKGSKVAILGTIRYGKWVDKHDQNRVSTDIIVETFRFLSPSPASLGNAQSYFPGEPISAGPVDGRATHRKPSTGKDVDESFLPDTNKIVPF